MSDTVKIHSKMRHWEWWGDSQCVHLFLHLLMEARKKSGQFQGHRIARGELIAKHGKLSSDTSIPPDDVKIRMKRWMNSGEIKVRSLNLGGQKYAVITIVNYDEHQQEDKVHKPPTEHAKQQAALKKNPYSKPFETWFAIYKKGAKGAAWIAWQQTSGKPELDKLIEISEQYKEYCESIDRPLSDAQGWINQRYFETEWTHEAQGTKPDNEEIQSTL